MGARARGINSCKRKVSLLEAEPAIVCSGTRLLYSRNANSASRMYSTEWLIFGWEEKDTLVSLLPPSPVRHSREQRTVVLVVLANFLITFILNMVTGRGSSV